MNQNTAFVCLLVFAGTITRADDLPLAELKAPDHTEPTISFADQVGGLPFIETKTTDSIAGRGFLGESGYFLDGRLSYILPNLRGSRTTLPEFKPVATWRVPELNAAELNNGPASYFLGCQLAVGYRFDGGWGEIIAAYRGAFGSRERWFANGDPRAFWFVQSKQDDDQTTDSDGNSTSSTPPKLELGNLDPFGVAHVTTNVTTSMLDLAYGNGLYRAGPLELRFVAGGRWGWFSVEDINEGLSIRSQENSRFFGFGPMASLYAELSIFGAEQSDPISIGLFGQATGSMLFGRSRQTDREEFTFPNPLSFRYAQRDEYRAVPVYGFEAGLVGRGREDGLAVMVGYQFEEWKHPVNVGGSRFDLGMHGIFLRVTLNY